MASNIATNSTTCSDTPEGELQALLEAFLDDDDTESFSVSEESVVGDVGNGSPKSNTSNMLQQTQQLVEQQLQDVQPAFDFYEAATDLRNNPAKVSEFTSAFQQQLEKCIVSKSRVDGINREASHTAFFALASGGLGELTAVSGNHQLTVWLALAVFQKVLDSSTLCPEQPVQATTREMASEEHDIVHYVGGFVVKKLQQRKQTAHTELLTALTTKDLPEKGTLLAAKSRGGLTNLTKEAKCMFLEMELVFRETFPSFADNVDRSKFQMACLRNEVIQSCFYNSTYEVEDDKAKESLLSDMIFLYFKVRVCHKCRTIVDSVRASRKSSSKDRALRSKLAK